MLLDVQNLIIAVNQDQESRDLVRGISFQIDRQEIIGLVGESGSGKSLTSLALMCLLNPPLNIRSGTITFKGEDLCTYKEKALQGVRGQQIAMIFQEPMSSLNPVMRCGDQVDEMMQIHHNWSKEKIRNRTLELFEKVQLPDVERIYRAFPHELSGGQLQRVMIAMAIACEPDLLIADECTTALDVTVQQEILELLRDLNKELGVAVLFISHDLALVQGLVDRVIVMRDGEIVEQGAKEQVFNAPKHPYTFQLLASRPPLDINLSKLPKPSFFAGDEMDYSSLEKFYNEHRKDSAQIARRKESIKASPILVEVKNLMKSYPSAKNFWGRPTAYVHAVKNISFNIRKGETLGLVGESGCGKSTLSKTLLALQPADSGDVLFNGVSIFGLSTRALRAMRKDIQYIFQDPYSSLNPRLSIGQAIQEPMEVHGVLTNRKARKERTMELLDLVGLEPDHYNRYPHQFSGGQRQRICIARALALDPKFIVCDEIVSALDVSVQAQVLNLLIELREKFELSLLFVSHDLSIVKFISDRILVMQQGNVVESGWVDEVYSNPKNPYTETLLKAIPK